MKKIILFSVLGLLLIAGGVAFYFLSLPPKETLTKEAKEQAITKLLGRKAQLDPVAEKTGNTTFNGKTITFDYPAKAVIYTYRDPNFASSSALLEDFSFDIHEPRLILNMSVLANHGKLKSIDDDSSVLFRHGSKGTYTEKLITVDGHPGKVYSRSDDSPEKTAFFLVNDKIYTISVTGTIFEEIEGLADSILKSVKFK